MLIRGRVTKPTWLQQGHWYGWVSVHKVELVQQPHVHMSCVSVCILRKVKLYPTLAVGTSLNLDLFVFHSQSDVKES